MNSEKDIVSCYFYGMERTCVFLLFFVLNSQKKKKEFTNKDDIGNKYILHDTHDKSIVL